MDKLEEIKRLYYQASARTIKQDLARAIAILKSMDSEDERERAAVFMDGLSQMRAEWGPKAAGKDAKAKAGNRRARRRSKPGPKPRA